MTRTQDAPSTGYATRNTGGPYAAAGVDLPLAWMHPSGYNPRRHFDQAALDDLAASIRTHGLLEPLVVRALGGRPDTFEIMAGERRYRAALIAGLETVPVRVLEGVDDRAALEIALIENLARQDLDPIEEAEGYRQLAQVCGLKQTEIATAVKRSQPAIAKSMSLLDLPPDVADHLRSGRLSVAHAVALVKYKKFPAVCSAVAKEAIEKNVTSHQLERTLPNPWGLERAGLVKLLYGSEIFDVAATCEHCPFGAYRPLPDGYKVCLHPEHYAEVRAAAEERRRQESAAQIAAAKEAGTAVFGADDLAYDQYSMIWGDPPAGCSEACPCRATRARADGQIERICTDPTRYRGLTEAERARQKDEAAARYTERMAALVKRLEMVDPLDARAIALIVRMALTRLSADDIKAALKDRGLSIKASHLSDYSFNAAAADALAALPIADLLRFGLYAVLRSELVHEREYGKTDSRSSYLWLMTVAEDGTAVQP